MLCAMFKQNDIFHEHMIMFAVWRSCELFAENEDIAVPSLKFIEPMRSCNVYKALSSLCYRCSLSVQTDQSK